MLVEGQRLFLAQGYTATSVDTICDGAGVTKGAFFHYFRSKDDFASQVLAFTWQPVLDVHAEIEQVSDPGARLAEHITFMTEWVCDTGRLVPMLAQELGATNPGIRTQVSGYFAGWMTYLEEFLRAAAADSGRNVDIGALREFIVATTEGIPVARNQLGGQAVANVTRHLVDAVMGALGR